MDGYSYPVSAYTERGRKLYSYRCEICGGMPYSTEQCHWCGQRFVQDKEIEEYAKPLTENGKCISCGSDVVIHVSKYNGHKHFHCDKCGFTVME